MTHPHFTLPSWNHDDHLPVGAKRLTCSVEGWNGNRVAGHLLDFDAEHRQLKVQAFSDPGVLALTFNQIKRLAVDPEPELDQDGQWPVPPAGVPWQTVVLHLRDGTLQHALVLSHRQVPAGLWLFPRRVQEGDPFRVFVPRASIARFEVRSEAGAVLSEADFSDSTIAIEDLLTPPTETTGGASAWVETPEQLAQALENQKRLRPVPIGEALLGLGKITPSQLAAALRRQKEQKTVPLGQLLVDMGLVTQPDLQTAFARKMGYPFVDVKKFPLDVSALRRVPLQLATRLKVLPLQDLPGALVVAMSDPLQFKTIEELEFTAQRKVIPVVTPLDELPTRIAKAYREIGMGDLKALTAHADAPTAMPDVATLNAGQDAFQLAVELAGESREQFGRDEERAIEQSDNTLVKLINSMILEAYQQRASDIHIEPYPGGDKLVVRFRVDGEMRPYLELPSGYRSALVARIKVMCDLDIAERRKPQDGKINFARFGGLPIELRVATIPTANGLEDVVMRILTSFKPLPMEGLDLSPANLAALERIVERPYGLFLCAGPTGSGKTTTLHSALQRLNRPNRKIWTAEDPVEITQRGLRQIQVNPKIGWTFASALRALLRADPDVIMVGEIRDHETAEMAIEASLTGHMVMSTLHTNSAAETIVRLIDLGVDPFSFADSLQGILAQRLVRRLCGDCVRRQPLSEERLRELVEDYQAALPAEHPERDAAVLIEGWRQRHGQQGQLHAHHAPGCDKCGQTGYRGRLALHELLQVSPDMRLLVQHRARPQELQALSLAQGMRTLRQDGIDKVLMGLTSLAEVRSSANV